MSWRQALATRGAQTLRVWLAVFPTVLLMRHAVGDAFVPLSASLQILLSTLTVVPVVTNLSLPLVLRAEAALRQRFGPPPGGAGPAGLS